jgi:hypothetical protein
MIVSVCSFFLKDIQPWLAELKFQCPEWGHMKNHEHLVQANYKLLERNNVELTIHEGIW